MTVIRQGNYNTITLEQWYANPIHCPFCGTPSDPESEPCKHLLYVILGGDFMLKTNRVDLAIGLPPGSGACDLMFSLEDKRKHGKQLETVARVRKLIWHGDTAKQWAGYGDIDAAGEIPVFEQH
jgi:hypothetical protein